jgi:flagellar biosynthesis/type III secretory pathway protein FliH
MNSVANSTIGKTPEPHVAAATGAMPGGPALRATRTLPAGPAEIAAPAPASGGSYNSSLESPEQAYARGLADGEARAQRQLRQQVEALDARSRHERDALAARASALSAATAGVDALARDVAAASEEMLARLTLLACARVLGALADEQRLLTQAVQATLAEFGQEPVLELLLHRDDLALLPADALAATGVALLPGEDVARGTFRLRTPHRRLDVDIAQQFERLCSVLQGGGDETR